MPYWGNLNIIASTGPMARNVEDLTLAMKSLINEKAYKNL